MLPEWGIVEGRIPSTLEPLWEEHEGVRDPAHRNHKKAPDRNSCPVLFYGSSDASPMRAPLETQEPIFHRYSFPSVLFHASLDVFLWIKFRLTSVSYIPSALMIIHRLREAGLGGQIDIPKRPLFYCGFTARPRSGRRPASQGVQRRSEAIRGCCP